ncbi:hypothetical protein D3C72_2044300 [compost metagenome]
MVGQVARDAVGGRRQEPAPADLEVPYRRLVALPRVVARGGAQVLVKLAHRGLLSLGEGRITDQRGQSRPKTRMIPDNAALSGVNFLPNRHCQARYFAM